MVMVKPFYTSALTNKMCTWMHAFTSQAREAHATEVAEAATLALKEEQVGLPSRTVQ